jgi:hypothetical protein
VKGTEKRAMGRWRLLKIDGVREVKKREGRGSGSVRGHTKKGGGGSARARGSVDAVDRYDMDAAAPGCSNSGGWHTLHGHSESGLRTGEGSGARA